MTKFFCQPARSRFARVATWVLVALAPLPAFAESVTLKSGLRLEGKIAQLEELAQNPEQNAEDKAKAIVMIDDDIRRVFVPKSQVANLMPVERKNSVIIPVEQKVAQGGSLITSVGVLLRVTPFDEFGRRTVTMQTSKGPINVIQGITKITPTYTELKGVVATKQYQWNTVIPTSSIPAETLSTILRKQAGDNIDARQKIVSLYIAAERYGDAKAELTQFQKDFPKLADTKKIMQSLSRAHADRIIKEIELRRDSGQHQLAKSMCENFPLEGTPADIRIRIADILQSYSDVQAQVDRVIALFDKQLGELTEERQRQALLPIREEIAKELNYNNLDRMADYLRLSDDETLKPEEKISLAVSAWFLGKGEGKITLSVAIMLIKVRNRVRDYLIAGHAGKREEVLTDLQRYEGTAPSYVARVLANMKPPLETPKQEKLPIGMYELSTPGLPGEADVQYVVQLPPEYDPYRRYPTIVTLNSQMTTPENQIAWWAGDYSEKQGMRLGQASRKGYIVIAPRWTQEHQTKYEFSLQEHTAVIKSLSDAVQRFSVDTDRVFISGHSMGGDAAWDIALSHPDLWAGVMPIGASTEKYIVKYYQNQRYVPLYYIAGEMDGDRFARCSEVLNRFLTGNNYDAVVVQYQGRGHEHFYDDILHLFDWMKIHKRDVTPKSFACKTMRPWDNYFWWVDVQDIPEKFITLPTAFQAKSPANAFVEATIFSRTSLNIKATDGCKTTIYLTPDMIDFEQPVTVNFRGNSKKMNLQPSLNVLLEDARQRGDRQHPFWQKIELGR